MALILIRHTRPLVAAGVCYGVSDLDCAESFEAEAADILARLPPVERILSSPLRRCLRLAERLAEGRGVPPTVDPRLREMDFGAWEGQAWSALARPEIDAWAADFHHARPHGGESVAMLAARVEAALAEHAAAPGVTAIVTHLGVIRAAMAGLAVEDAWRFEAPFGAIVPLDQPPAARQ